MGALHSLAALERHAFASGEHPECYRAVDLARFFGTSSTKISRVRSANKARFPGDFYLGSGIYTRRGVLALAGRLQTDRAIEVSIEMLEIMFGEG